MSMLKETWWIIETKTLWQLTFRHFLWNIKFKCIYWNGIRYYFYFIIIGKFVDYNASERFITFKMGTKYNVTVQNDDKVFLDTSSALSKLPK